jgi:hypothetical protein
MLSSSSITKIFVCTGVIAYQSVYSGLKAHLPSGSRVYNRSSGRAYPIFSRPGEANMVRPHLQPSLDIFNCTQFGNTGCRKFVNNL